MNTVRNWRRHAIKFLLPLCVLNRKVRTESDSMLGTPPSVCPIRLRSVTGYDGRVNDVVYCHPATRNEQNTAVVFFGGDVQDFPENMESHRDNKNYVKWNLESTAALLHTFFPDSHVVVVRPSRIGAAISWTFQKMLAQWDELLRENRMEFKTFSCYDNFVPCNNCGAPDHTPTHYALQHLERLMQGISQRIRSLPTSELEPLAEASRRAECAEDEGSTSVDVTGEVNQSDGDGAECAEDPVIEENGSVESKRERGDSESLPPFWWQEGINLDKAELVLVGFSKGCVVLNQFIYEFHYIKTLTPDDDTMMRLVSRIRDMYWLDGGHAGGKNTYITSRSLLETLTRLGIGIHIHVTPYQVQDERRPWIRKEEKAFTDLLRRLGAPVNRTLHFENQVASLYTHFEVLNAFKQPVK